MGRISHVATFGELFSGRLHMFDDLAFGVVEGVPTLHGVSRSGNGMATWSLSGEAVVHRDHQDLPSGGFILGGLDLLSLSIDGRDHIAALAGGSAGVASFALGSSGQFAEEATRLVGPGLDGAISTAEAVDVGGQEMLYSVKLGTARIQIGEVGAGGDLLERGSVILPSGGQDVSDMAAILIGTKYIMVATSAWSDRVYTFQVTLDGDLRQGQSFGAAEGLGIDAPTVIKTYEIAGQAYAVVGSSGSSSLSVLALGADGSVLPLTHMIDDLNTRFQYVTALDVVETGGRVFVAAGGADDGFTLFEALPNGELLLIGNVIDTWGTTLQNVADLALTVVGSTVHIAVSSATEAGVSLFSMELPTESQQITDTAGDDTITGGAGDDIIRAGRGSDDINAGAGFDIIILEADGQPDLIRNFEVGVDLIDLSSWGDLRGVDQLRTTITGNGGRIFYGDEVLTIFPNPRGPLTHEEIKRALSLSFQDAPIGNVLPEGVQEGTANNDVLMGRAAADTISGQDGDDEIHGFGSADELSGGLGADTLDGGDGTDLLMGEADNDVVMGMAGDDRILGGIGHDTLHGGLGADAVDGEDGDDILLGEDGDDLLNGGLGADVLDGGDGRDTLLGGSGNDSLSGGAENDTLNGDAGDDLLAGDAGNDVMFGGDGRDTLTGGVGNDRIDGGAGADFLVGGEGSDMIIVDTLADNVGEDRQWAGQDTVQAFVSFSIVDDHVEELHLRGTAVVGIGNTLDNEIRGNNEDNVLDGGQGRDTLIGGAGDDTYLVRSAGDTVIEAKGSGAADLVRAFRAYQLPDNVERLELMAMRDAEGNGVRDINGIGNDGANTVIGNPFDNLIIGRGGQDVLFGGAGADTFVFDRGISRNNVDRIVDFNATGADEGDMLMIKLSRLGDAGLEVGVLSAEAYTPGLWATEADDRFIFHQPSGRLWFDVDGAGGAAQRLLMTFDDLAVVGAEDILLY